MPVPPKEPVGQELTWEDVDAYGLEPVPDGMGPSIDEIAEGLVDAHGNPLEDAENTEV